MLNVLRIMLAFLLAPLAGLLLTQLIAGIPYLWTTLVILALLYLFVLMASIPTFSITRYWVGWSLHSCIVAATITSLLVWLWGWFVAAPPGSRDYGSMSYFSEPWFIMGAIVGTAVYGVVFWLIVKNRKLRDE